MLERLPLVVITGFLGSGKTTLVRRFLDSDGGRGTGVIVNEFGETGLDHKLLVHAADQVELVAKGCLCCARRADVARALHDLVGLSRRDGGGFIRAVIETSGLADPSPIIATLVNDPWMRAHIELTRVVAVVDSVAGLRNLDAYSEARRQVAIADTIVVTKGDLRRAAPLDEITRAIRLLTPDADILDAQDADFRPTSLFSEQPGLSAKSPRARFIAEAVDHERSVGSFVLALPNVVDWAAMTVWLSALLHKHGDRILRVKGMIRTSPGRNVVVIHGVQHTMHPPSHIQLTVGDNAASFLVFITNGLKREVLAQSFAAFMAFAAERTPASRVRRLPRLSDESSRIGQSA
jgi:G3E family GTPase